MIYLNVIGLALVVALFVFGVPVSADSAAESGDVAINVAMVASAAPRHFASDTTVPVADPVYPAPSAGCTAAAVHSWPDHARQQQC